MSEQGIRECVPDPTEAEVAAVIVICNAGSRTAIKALFIAQVIQKQRIIGLAAALSFG